MNKIILIIKQKTIILRVKTKHLNIKLCISQKKLRKMASVMVEVIGAALALNTFLFQFIN